MNIPTYKAPDGVNGPTLGGYLPEGCDRLEVTCVPQNESTWVQWDEASKERIELGSLYWWRLPAFKKGDRVQIFGTVDRSQGTGENVLVNLDHYGPLHLPAIILHRMEES